MSPAGERCASLTGTNNGRTSCRQESSAGRF
jgi:hypothetical protein